MRNYNNTPEHYHTSSTMGEATAVYTRNHPDAMQAWRMHLHPLENSIVQLNAQMKAEYRAKNIQRAIVCVILVMFAFFGDWTIEWIDNSQSLKKEN